MKTRVSIVVVLVFALLPTAAWAQGQVPPPPQGGVPNNELVKTSGNAVTAMNNQMQEFSKILSDVSADAGKQGCVKTEMTKANGLIRAATNANNEVISYSGSQNFQAAQQSLNVVLTSKEKMAAALNKAKTCAAGIGAQGDSDKSETTVDSTGGTTNISNLTNTGLANATDTPAAGGVGGAVGAEAGGSGTAGGQGTGLGNQGPIGPKTGPAIPGLMSPGQ